MNLMRTLANIGIVLSSITGNDHNPLSTANFKEATPTTATRTAEPGIDLSQTYFVSTTVPQDPKNQGYGRSSSQHRYPNQQHQYSQPIQQRPMQYGNPTYNYNNYNYQQRFNSNPYSQPYYYNQGYYQNYNNRLNSYNINPSFNGNFRTRNGNLNIYGNQWGGGLNYYGSNGLNFSFRFR